MPDFERYPLTMSHPAFKKSVAVPVPGTQVFDAEGKITRQDYQGTPERFPPVTVEDEMHEEYYKAQGYAPAGKSDPAAWVTAHSEAVPESYVPDEYPKWVDGKLIASAEDDPDYVAPEPVAETAEVPAPLVAADPDEIAALKAKIAELEAMKDKRTAPRKVPQAA
jgi:hypothetical protein